MFKYSTFLALFLCSICLTGQNSDSQDTHNEMLAKYDMYAPSALAALAPGDVGYYDMSAGQGVSPEQSDPITNAGFSPVQIFDLSAIELANIDVLMVYNPSNDSYGAEYLAQLAVIEAAVNNGLV